MFENYEMKSLNIIFCKCMAICDLFFIKEVTSKFYTLHWSYYNLNQTCIFVKMEIQTFRFGQFQVLFIKTCYASCFLPKSRWRYMFSNHRWKGSFRKFMKWTILHMDSISCLKGQWSKVINKWQVKEFSAYPPSLIMHTFPVWSELYSCSLIVYNE